MEVYTVSNRDRIDVRLQRGEAERLARFIAVAILHFPGRGEHYLDIIDIGLNITLAIHRLPKKGGE